MRRKRDSQVGWLEEGTFLPFLQGIWTSQPRCYPSILRLPKVQLGEVTPQGLLTQSIRPAQVLQGEAERLWLSVVQVNSSGFKKKKIKLEYRGFVYLCYSPSYFPNSPSYFPKIIEEVSSVSGEVKHLISDLCWEEDRHPSVRGCKKVLWISSSAGLHHFHFAVLFSS